MDTLQIIKELQFQHKEVEVHLMESNEDYTEYIYTYNMKGK